MKRFWSILLPLAAAGLLAACSGVSLTGPNVTLLAPAVRGQVVDDATGEPLRGARVGREPLPPPPSARTETGAQRLATRDPAARRARKGGGGGGRPPPPRRGPAATAPSTCPPSARRICC